MPFDFFLYYLSIMLNRKIIASVVITDMSTKTGFPFCKSWWKISLAILFIEKRF